MKLPAITRDRAILTVALSGLIYETVFADPVNLGLVGAFVSLLGLPVVLKVDENRRTAGAKEPNDD
jgi:hypothetical protein